MMMMMMMMMINAPVFVAYLNLGIFTLSSSSTLLNIPCMKDYGILGIKTTFSQAILETLVIVGCSLLSKERARKILRPMLCI